MTCVLLPRGSWGIFNSLFISLKTQNSTNPTPFLYFFIFSGWNRGWKEKRRRLSPVGAVPSQYGRGWAQAQPSLAPSTPSVVPVHSQYDIFCSQYGPTSMRSQCSPSWIPVWPPGLSQRAAPVSSLNALPV